MFKVTIFLNKSTITLSLRIMMSHTVAMEIVCITQVGSILFRKTVVVEKILYKSQLIIFLVENGQKYLLNADI